MMTWHALHPRSDPEMLGLLPDFLKEEDPRSAREQIHERYAHGGGWLPCEGFEILTSRRLLFSGSSDRPLEPLAETKLRDEIIRLYEHSWVAIIQPDGSFEVARID